MKNQHIFAIVLTIQQLYFFSVIGSPAGGKRITLIFFLQIFKLKFVSPTNKKTNKKRTMCCIYGNHLKISPNSNHWQMCDRLQQELFGLHYQIWWIEIPLSMHTSLDCENFFFLFFVASNWMIHQYFRRGFPHLLQVGYILIYNIKASNTSAISYPIQFDLPIWSMRWTRTKKRRKNLFVLNISNELAKNRNWLIG